MNQHRSSPLNASTAQLLNALRVPLNARPTKHISANFWLRSCPALFPASETEAFQHPAPSVRDLVLNDIK
jgi:hypothetical protein